MDAKRCEACSQWGAQKDAQLTIGFAECRSDERKQRDNYVRSETAPEHVCEFWRDKASVVA